MQIKTLFITMMAGMLLLASCKKGSELAAEPNSFKFESLTTDDTSIVYSINPSTKITAIATGDELKYYWSATAGDILGSGYKITYTANPGCCGGYQAITCKVKDKYGNLDVKQVRIYVSN